MIKLVKTLLILGIINFVSFYFLVLFLGGDAVNGHTSNGKYYLANHGEITEVTKGIYIYSKIHVYSQLLTFPLFIICGYYIASKKGWQNKIG